MSTYKRETKNGIVYGVRFFVIDKNGKKVFKNLSPFRTKKEALAAEYEYKKAFPQFVEETLANEIPTFAELYKKWYKVNINVLSPSSIYTYNNIINKYVMPTFGDYKIDDITKKAVSNWQDNLPQGLSAKYLLQLRSSFSNIMAFAIEKDYITDNPVLKVSNPKRRDQKKVMQFWTKDEFLQFISVVNNPTYKALFSFLYASGCRKGEAFALRWSDIHFDKSTVTIEKSFTKKGRIVCEQIGVDIFEQTKNKKSADIYMPKSVMDLLNNLPRTEYVFGDRPLAETSVTRQFNHYIQLANVKKIRLHDLRHSCAALMISNSTSELATLYAIADRLRDTVEMVLTTYGHLFPSKQAEAIRIFNEDFPKIK